MEERNYGGKTQKCIPHLQSLLNKPPFLEMINNVWLCLHSRSEKWDNVKIVCRDASSVYTNLYQQPIITYIYHTYNHILPKNALRFREKHMYVCMHLAKICFNEILPS